MGLREVNERQRKTIKELQTAIDKRNKKIASLTEEVAALHDRVFEYTCALSNLTGTAIHPYTGYHDAYIIKMLEKEGIVWKTDEYMLQ